MMLLRWVSALMVRNLTWLSMFMNFFCSFQHLAADVSWISQSFFLCCLRLPVNVRKHLLRIIGHSICKDGIKDPYQLTADRNHGLFLLERIIRSCRVILMQWLKLWVLRYQRNCCIEPYCPQLTPTSFASVSYTHLDVYKRQIIQFNFNILMGR